MKSEELLIADCGRKKAICDAVENGEDEDEKKKKKMNIDCGIATDEGGLIHNNLVD